MECKIFRTDKEAVFPSRAHPSDAGYDLTIIKEVKRFTDNTVLYDTGIKIIPPYEFYSEIIPRSSLSKSGYMLANSVGVIDTNYRGNLMIALTKINPESPDIVLPFRCCQLIFRRQSYIHLREYEFIDTNTDRNSNGFGSSG